MRLSSRDMFVGGIILVTVLAVTDMRYGGALRLPTAFDGVTIDGQNRGFNANEAPTAQSVRHLSLKSDGVRGLDLYNQMGSVTVAGGKTDQVEVTYTVKVFGGSADKAREYAEKLKVEAKRSGDELMLSRASIQAPKGTRGVTVDYKVEIPISLKLSVDNHFGPLQVGDLGAGAELSNAYGQLTAVRVKGDSRIDVKYGEAIAQSIMGNLDISAAYGRSSVRDVSGAVVSSASYGPFSADNTGGDLECNSRYGDVQIRGVGGNVRVDAKYSPVMVDEFKGKADVTSRYGQVTLRGLTKDATVDSKAGRVELELKNGVGGFRVGASVSRGNFVNSTGSAEPFVEERRDKRGSGVDVSGKTGEATHSVDVNTSMGDIVLTYAP